MSGIEKIAAERKRQISEEGWGSAHDDQHVEGELISAAICYASYACHDIAYPDAPSLKVEMYLGEPGRLWPWDDEWFKPSTDPVRNLVKAGALLVAEIDRLERKVRKGL